MHVFYIYLMLCRGWVLSRPNKEAPRGRSGISGGDSPGVTRRAHSLRSDPPRHMETHFEQLFLLYIYIYYIEKNFWRGSDTGSTRPGARGEAAPTHPWGRGCPCPTDPSPGSAAASWRAADPDLLRTQNTSSVECFWVPGWVSPTSLGGPAGTLLGGWGGEILAK